VICPLAFVGQADARLGTNVMVNVYACVGHDVSIDRHSVL